MLGIQDPFVWLAYVLCIGSVAFCVTYGVRNWNRGDEPADAITPGQDARSQEEP